MPQLLYIILLFTAGGLIHMGWIKKLLFVWLGSLVVSVSEPMTARSWVRSLTTASNNLGLSLRPLPTKFPKLARDLGQSPT